MIIFIQKAFRRNDLITWILLNITVTCFKCEKCMHLHPNYCPALIAHTNKDSSIGSVLCSTVSALQSLLYSLCSPLLWLIGAPSVMCFYRVTRSHPAHCRWCRNCGGLCGWNTGSCHFATFVRTTYPVQNPTFSAALAVAAFSRAFCCTLDYYWATTETISPSFIYINLKIFYSIFKECLFLT